MPSKRCYLYLGPEIGEKQDALKELREGLRAGGVLEEQSWYAGETPIQTICGIIGNGVLFSDRRLFIIKNAEAVKKKDDLDCLTSCIDSLDSGAVLVLVTDETKVDPRLEKAADPKNKRVFWELFENRKTEWLRSFFLREGFRISAEAAETVLELVENNTEALRRECSRLCLFMDKDRTVEADDVEKWLSHSREESAFTLFSRIASADLERSVETLHALLAAKESAQSILAGLIWCYRKFRDYLAILAEGPADDFAFRRAGLSSPRARKDYENLARRLGSADNPLALIAEFDLLIRGAGGGTEGFLLDLLVWKLIAAPDKPRETMP